MNSAAANSLHPMPLNQLLADIACDSPAADAVICDLQLDSRRVKAGTLFIALRGQQDDGTRYIESAVSKGAAAVLVDSTVRDSLAGCAVPVVGVEQLKDKVSHLAARFFRQPSRQLDVVGVTGTNGKTSCCQFIAQALTQLGVECGVIGTLGYGFVGDLHETAHTTPDAIAVQRMLADLVSREMHAVAMEVSSHGIDQGRVAGVRFDTAVFTNLSRDHLDYHGDMASYGETKKQLFLMSGVKHAVVNIDDEFGRQLVDQLPDRLAVYRYGLNSQHADIRCANIELSAKGIRASLLSPWGAGILTSPLVGQFNLSNLLAVFTVLCTQGFSVQQALSAIAGLDTVPGRMETYGGGSLPLVVVDYAHTPDALGTALRTLRTLGDGKLWCLFGCGGDRDQGKRMLMGEVAEQLSDELILTNDNPRSESPEQIIEDIKSGLLKLERIRIELDRAKAIQLAVDRAEPGDLILIAGKGHEPYQEIKGARIAFSDAEQVKQALNIKALGTSPDIS